MNFQSPSSKYNSWAKVKTDDSSPIVTWTNPEDIVFIVRNDVRAFLDVNVLAEAFNIEKATLLGNIITVDDFDVYDDDGEKIYDGSNIIGGIFDKSWFRIKRQDMFLDTFYNPNNRTMQYYLNLIKLYNFSLFANGVIFSTALPEPDTDFEMMTKAQLLEYCTENNIDGVTSSMTKAEIIAVIEEALNT